MVTEEDIIKLKKWYGLDNSSLKDNCSICNSVLEEMEQDSSEMTDGQLADYEMGFNRTFFCPTCQVTSLNDVNNPYIDESETIPAGQLEALRKGRNTAFNNKRTRGYIGEMWYANELRKEGHTVVNTMKYDYLSGKSIFNKDGVKNLLSKLKNSQVIFDFLEKIPSGLPDLICLKNNNISFYEIKIGTSGLNEESKKPHQIEVANQLKEIGYDVFTIRLSVKYKIKLAE